jgi:hypothetical protein
MYKAGNSVEQVFGGTVIKQGDQTPLGFNFRDENGQLVSLLGATVQVKIASNKGVVVEKQATISDGYTVTFSLGQDDITGSGDMMIEFIVTYSSGLQEKFPSDDWQRIRITPTLEDVEKYGIGYITFEKLTGEFQHQFNEFTGGIDQRIDDQKKRVDNLINSTPQPSEIVDARRDENGNTFANVKAHLDDKGNKIGNLQKKISTIISLDSYEHLIPNKNTIADTSLWDWSDALKAANDYTFNNKIVATIKVSGFKKFNKGVVLDTTYTSFDFSDSELDFSAINDGSSAFTFQGGKKTWNNLSYQNMRFVKGLFMRGGGKTSNSKGITFNSPTGSIQGVSFWHCDIKEFGTCASFEQNAYLLSFFNCSIGRGNIGVHMPSGFTNYGENIAFFGGVVGNCNLAIKNENSNGNFHFNGTSIDYSGAIAEAVAGGIFFSNNHIEHNNAGTPLTDIPFKTGVGDSAKIVFSNVFLMFWTVPNLDYLFYTENTKQAGGIKLVNTNLFNAKTNTGILCGGTGLIEFVGDPLLYEGSGNMSASPITSTANNRLIDGLFEDSAVLDAYISKDTATINNRVTGTNLQLTLDTTVFYEGTKSLKVNKVGGASSTSGISFMVPVDSGRHHSWQFYLNKGTVTTGAMYVTDQYVSLLNVNSSGIPTFQKTKTKATRSVDMSTLTTGWQKQTCPLALSKAPRWATHYVITFNLDAMGAGAFNIDSFIATSL